MGIQFDKDLLAVEQNNYLRKIVNVYIVYDLDAWPRNPTNNFKFKSIKEKSKIVIKKSLSIVDTEWHLIGQVGGVLIMVLLEMLLFFTLIIVHHFIRTIARIFF